MRSLGRCWKRGAAAALAAGLIGVAGTAAPTGAQEADPPPSSSTTVAPTTTAPATTVPTTAPAPPASTPPGSAPTTATTTGTTPPATGAPSPPGTVAPPATTAAADPAAPAPAAAAAAGTITLVPDEDLTDGTPVVAQVSGLPANTFVGASQCLAGVQDAPPDQVFESCDSSETSFAQTDGAGAVRFDLRVDALLATGFDEPAVTDCRPAGACVIAVLVEGDEGLASGVLVTPLDMVPDGALAPPPTLSVTPDAQLGDRQSVRLDAAGLVWAYDAVAIQCRAEPIDAGDCDDSTAASLFTGDGRVTSDLRVLAVIDTDRGPVDCRTEACAVVVAQDFLRTAARRAAAPISFDPTTVVVPPTLTVTPATGLVDGQTVAARGSGFHDQFVELYECPPDPADGCRLLDGFGFVENGGFTTQVAVDAIVTTTAGEEIDCRTSPDPCLLVASASRPTSVRAGRAELRFAPGGPLRPAPVITLDPATDLPDQGAVTVNGRNFAASFGRDVQVEVCEAGAARRCDPQAETFVSNISNGRFSVDIDVAATFAVGSATVDCRAEPGCQVVATVGFNGRRATAALDFAPFVPPDERYVETVFTEVEVTRGVVYRHTTDATGTPVDLALDIYQPAGDTEAVRPAVVWLPGGWFSGGDTVTAATYAQEFARRGYVAVTMSYRQRPGLRCCPTDDVEGVTEALLDAYDDARAGVRWLRDHAAEYRIDPDAIAAGGVAAGGAAAASLAHLPGQMGHGGSSLVAAAVPVAAVDLGRPDRGEPPVLFLHGGEDDTAPLHLSQTACARARRVGAVCGAYGYAGVWDPGRQRQRDVVRRSSDFLAEMMLDPLGYLEWTGPSTVPVSPPSTTPGSPPASPPGGGPGTTPPGGQPLPVALTAAPGPAAGVAAAATVATLPRTGAETARLVAVAFGLLLVGVALLAVRRRRRAVGDGGSAGVGVAVAIALVALMAGAFVVTGGLLSTTTGGDEPTDEAAHDHGDHPDAATDHDDADHDDGAGTGADHSGHDTAGDGAATDHTGHALGPAAHPTGHTTGDHDGTGGEVHDIDGHGTGAGDHGGPTHHDPGPTGGPTHPHDPGPPGGPTHPHDPGPPGGPTHPPEPPDDGIDPNWSPERQAFARALIADTEASLVRYGNTAVLPLVGYRWIGDGTGRNQYQHWIHLGRISDPRRLDPETPESLVFRNAAGGPVLEAAMYMLPPGFTLTNIPAEIAWLPGWHVHENLCFENGFDLVGVTVNGRCERGNVIVTPPMVHVWIVDTRCGRFAGVDEFGLQCHHEH